jgi:hypothetical protein
MASGVLNFIQLLASLQEGCSDFGIRRLLISLRLPDFLHSPHVLLCLLKPQVIDEEIPQSLFE